MTHFIYNFYKKQMKKTLFLSVGLLALAACNNQKSSSSNNNEPSKAENPDTIVNKSIGGSTDKHGCLTGAGQTWSEMKQDCIQIFNVGKRLNPVETKQGDMIVSAFVVFNSDKSKAELFVPDVQQTIILNKSEGNTYKNDTYKLTADDMVLYINNHKKYVAEK